MKVAEMQQEALSRAVCGRSTMNYSPIVEGFMAKGLSPDQIIPRENVFTYRAWQAVGRQVRKGEHGVRVTTFVPMNVKDKAAKPGEPGKKGISVPRTTTVFHVSQTDPI